MKGNKILFGSAVLLMIGVGVIAYQSNSDDKSSQSLADIAPDQRIKFCADEAEKGNVEFPGCFELLQQELARVNPEAAEKHGIQADPNAHEGHGHEDHSNHAKSDIPRLPKLKLEPRKLTLEERIADRAAAERLIGPERPLDEFGTLGKDANGTEVLFISEKLGGGTYYGNNVRGNKRVVSYALAPFESTFFKKETIEGMHSGMYDHSEHHHCAQVYVNNRYERGEPNLTEKVNANLILHIAGDGETQTIDDVESLWPESAKVDDETRLCYEAAFRGLQWKGTETRGYYMDWPVCINPPPVANDNTVKSANDSTSEGA